MIELTLRRDTDVALYRQIVCQVRDLIRSGSLPTGYRLPPVRRLAERYGMTRLTVHSAYAELQAQGLVESYVGRGTFVAAEAVGTSRQSQAAEPPDRWVSEGVLAEMLQGSGSATLSLAQAFPAPGSYPTRDLGRCLQKVAGTESAWGYGPMQGDANLREQTAGLLLARGLAVLPDHMLITAGAQQGIDLVLRALLEPTDVVLVEQPTYPGVLQLAAQRGQRVVGVPVDSGGINPGALEAACKAYAPRLLYLVPTFANPTGVCLAPERRSAVLRIARDHNLLLLEDDVYGLLAYDGTAPPPLKTEDSDGRVIYLTSFSKVLAPALRLGALVAPISMMPALAAAKQSSDLVCSSLLQQALAGYLRRGDLDAHLRDVRSMYRQRRDTMLAALQRDLPQCRWTYPGGGLSLWAGLPDGVVERDFTADAMAAGVAVAPGRVFFTQPQRGAWMRLSFSMHADDRIEEAVATLGDVLLRHSQRRTEMLSLAGRMAEPLV